MKHYLLMAGLLAVLIFSSCSRKSYVYLQDMDDMTEYPIPQKYEAIIHRDDKLSIIVNSKNPELTIPFNIPGGGGFSVSSDGTVTSSSNGADNGKSTKGYLVDINGDIDFPILGKLHVEGLTRNQLTELIKNKLIIEDLIKEPIVHVDFLNFKFSVLGEVGKVGTYEVTGDRITLLEALAMAGDLNQQARVDRVAVIREYGNKRRIFFHDLRKKDIFDSPCFYLQQNDVVYVEPGSQQAEQKMQRRYSLWTMLLTSVTTITSLVFLFTK